MSLAINNTAFTQSLENTMSQVQTQLNNTLQSLSTGTTLNQSSDNPADMFISQTLTSQINGDNTASQNVQQGLSMLNTADSAMQQINGYLQNIRDIAVAASNATTTTTQFTAYQAGVQADISAINNVTSNTKFGSNVLLDGSIPTAGSFKIQTGPNSGDAIDISAAFSNNTAGASGLGVTQNTLTTTANATTLLGQIDSALNTLNTNQASLGGYEDTLNNQLNYLSVAQTNTQAAQSSISDTNVAQAVAKVAQLQILEQAGAYAMAQANNSMTSVALKLLQ